MSEQWPLRYDRDGRPQPMTPPSPVVNVHDEQSAMLSPTSHSTPTGITLQDPPSAPSSTNNFPARSHFVSSRLNPTSPLSPFARSRPQSRTGSMHINRVASEETYALSTPYSTLASGQRGSMVLYRLATEDENGALLVPPTFPGHQNRDSVVSSSGDSIVSLSSDSKYPQGYSVQRGLVPYAYDPALDEKEPPDEVDLLHDPGDGKDDERVRFAMRGILNVGVLVLLIAGLLCLFIIYPVLKSLQDSARNKAIDDSLRINATGQSPALFQMPDLVDPDTPQAARTRTGYDGHPYNLVFSDEFNVDGRTFYPGDDPFWEAADLWYWATADQEWYDPAQVTTKNGYLQITMENIPTNGMPYRSGMLQSWNKFCFSSGYIEVSLTLPGPDQDTQGYWPGVWTMGNLARPGYGATTKGAWPYTYDACDVGTFPNQTFKDGTGPAAALHSDFSRAKYNYELSWQPGQKLSACTCPGEDHPGPTNSKGRGAPEIDVLEAEKNKIGPGHVVSQSAQFAPFTHDYIYLNATNDQWEVYDPSITQANVYRGSAVQQAVSGLTLVPPNVFQGSGAQFTKFGFEYWANPTNRDEGFITWQVNGKPTNRLGATAVGPDQGPGGSGVSQRLIPEEPMSIVLNLGISPNWQTINLASMEFPAIMQIDYVRVYQREGHTNIGCNPSDYPTADYINRHLDSYTNPNLTTWNYPWPKNSLYDGC